MSESRIRGLPIWQGEIEIEPLDGGLTNLNYKVRDGERTYAVRAGEDDVILGIDRQNERVCARAAADLGVAPGIAWCEGGLTVAQFIDGQALTVETANSSDRLEQIAATLRCIHEEGVEAASGMSKFTAFEVARSYIATAIGRGNELPGPSKSLSDELTELESCLPAYRPTFCHNDMMPGNVIIDESRVWIIDWEYAGCGDPCFDLAGFASNCEFDPATEQRWLKAYHGSVTAESERHFRILKAMAALRECLWAVIKGEAAEIAFDYGGYRDENWEKYRAALREV